MILSRCPISEKEYSTRKNITILLRTQSNNDEKTLLHLVDNIRGRKEVVKLVNLGSDFISTSCQPVFWPLIGHLEHTR